MSIRKNFLTKRAEKILSYLFIFGSKSFFKKIKFFEPKIISVKIRA